MEFERVADYKTDEIERLVRMPIHNYYLHILALKKRSDEMNRQDEEEEDF